MKPTNDNDQPNDAVECDDEDLETDMAIAEEAEAHYREHGITGTRPYSEYIAERLKRSDMAQQPPRGKYQPLYAHLCNLRSKEWRATFGEIEAILGSALPPSARKPKRNAWWGNERNSGGRQCRAWILAGWKTAEVDRERETLLFYRSP